MVKPLSEPSVNDGDNETEFGTEKAAEEETTNKRKRSAVDEGETKEGNKDESKEEVEQKIDPELVELLKTSTRRNLFPPGAVWRVNVGMFHGTIKALLLGRLVAERYGNKVQSAGSLVTAALKLAAHRKYAVKDSANDDEGTHLFTPLEITKYLPSTVLDKYKSKAGGKKYPKVLVLSK